MTGVSLNTPPDLSSEMGDAAVRLNEKIHVAIIMDGNGRWAARRGRPRSAGHIMGAKPVSAIVEEAVRCGIGILTLYAFSSDNWKRPTREVSLLMKLFRRYLLSEIERCVTNGVRIRVIGRRDRLPGDLVQAIERAERITARGKNLELRIAVDYSSRESILMAVKTLASSIASGSCPDEIDREALGRAMNDAIGSGEIREVDLLIRTGGEQRLSDFMLWECAYAELYFTTEMWPDFGVVNLRQAVSEYCNRDRRYGAVKTASVAV